MVVAVPVGPRHAVEHVVDRRVALAVLARLDVEHRRVQPHPHAVARVVELGVDGLRLDDAELVGTLRAVADVDVRERVRDQLAEREPQQRRVAVRPRARRAAGRPRVLVRRAPDPGQLDVLGVAEAHAVGEAGAAEDPAVGRRHRLAARAEQAARAAPVLAEERLVVHADVVDQVLLVGDRGQVLALLLLRERRAGRVGEEVLVRGLDAQDARRAPRPSTACARGTPSTRPPWPAPVPANGPALRAGITWSVPNSAAGKSSRW